MQPDNQRIDYGAAAATETRNRVLRNTYALLGISLVVSAVMAYVSMSFGLPHPGLLITLGVYFGLLFAIHKFQDADFAILLVFALTGFLGYTIGPIVGYYLAVNPNVVVNAFTMTAVTFIGLSAFVIMTKKDFNFLGGFLFAGILAAFVAGLIAYFFNMPGLAMAVSYAFVMLMVGLILFETSRIVNGGETNYVLATVTLFVSIYNLFSSLMHIFGMADE
ncbi:MAG: Bax inhibitor-1/YccA family protein [Pseudomonadota bacterium]